MYTNRLLAYTLGIRLTYTSHTLNMYIAYVQRRHFAYVQHILCIYVQGIRRKMMRIFWILVAA